eukprot:g6002.t1
MYSSKPIHKNKHDTSYITIGDPYDRIPSKSEKNPRYHGKQFSTVFPKKGNIPSKVCFGDMKLGPQGKFLAEPLYIQSQPLDKRHLGFGSHDAFRRDEFSNTIRTRQLREALAQEKSTFQRSLLKGEAPNPRRLHDNYQSQIDSIEEEIARLEKKTGLGSRVDGESKRRDVAPTEFLYDIGRNRNTEFNPKISGDRFYVPNIKREKAYGKTHTTSQRHGMQEGCETKIDRKAEFVYVHSTDAFYDNTHLSV